MRKFRSPIVLVAGAGTVLLLLAGATHPAMFALAKPGLWELSGPTGAGMPARQCLKDLARLSQWEHRAATCTRTVVRDESTFAEVHYSCAGRGFGQTTIKLITPRSLRVETQGISGGVPFHYVLQARRVGECPRH